MQLAKKGSQRAEVFLRQLYREGRLSAKDLSVRLQAVQDLAAGKLRPQVLSEKDAGIFVGAKVDVGSSLTTPAKSSVF